MPEKNTKTVVTECPGRVSHREDPGPVLFLVGNGTDGVYDRVEYKYNRQGQRIELKDQNGTVHQYEYDALGRATDDKVATLGTGVDGTVRRIERAYEVRGMVEEVTSYNAATGGSAVNGGYGVRA